MLFFYSNALIDPITGKNLCRKEYAIRLIQKFGLTDIFLSVDYYSRNRQVI
jgi:hypothetical protein